FCRRSTDKTKGPINAPIVPIGRRIISTSTWFILYLLNLCFCGWIFYLGGDHRLEKPWLGGFLFGAWPTEGRTETFRATAWLSLIGSTLWFVIGLLWPWMRDVHPPIW